LLKAGADVDGRSDNRATALHEAVRFDHPGIVRELMTAKPEMARYDREGLHPLALAAALGRLACLQTLFTAGAEADLPDRTGLTALFWARRYDRALAEVILVEHGASREAWPIQVD
jgi:ankyrin repeat protein